PVHEAGTDDVPLGIDDLPRVLADAADRGDLAVADADVRPITGKTRTIYHRAVPDYEVVGHFWAPIGMNDRGDPARATALAQAQARADGRAAPSAAPSRFRSEVSSATLR